VEDKAGAAGGNVGLDAERTAREKRHERLPIRGGLVALLGVVAIAGCGGDDEKDAPGAAGGARKSAVNERTATSGTKLETLDRQKVSGKFATAQAAGTVKAPKRILLSIKATPPQKVQAAWSLTCLKGQKAGTKDGLRVVESPIAMTLKQPMKGNDSCVVAATAQLTKKGEVIVKLASTSR
jgi:hypothetical protein